MSLRRWVACGALALVQAATPAVGEELPVYLRRLSLPVAENDIQFGQCVTADLHTGEIFVCDPRANRILIFDRDGQFDFQVLGSTEMSSPEDIAVDPDGYLLVAASRGRSHGAILELDFDGLFLRQIEIAGLPAGAETPRVTSLALSPTGDRIYAVDAANKSLWIVGRDGTVLAGIDYRLGREGDGDSADLMLGRVDVYGERVLVPVTSDGEVRLLDLEGRPIGVVGIRGGSRCRMLRPVAAALGDDGEVLVVDEQRMVLTRWQIDGNRCTGDFLRIGAEPGMLYFPADLGLDAEGRFYIAQTFEGRVQMYEGLGVRAAAPALGTALSPRN